MESSAVKGCGSLKMDEHIQIPLFWEEESWRRVVCAPLLAWIVVLPTQQCFLEIAEKLFS